MYRPTMMYDDTFKKYVDGLFHSTTLDRNQIIRAALSHLLIQQHLIRLLMLIVSVMPFLSPTVEPIRSRVMGGADMD